MATTRVGISGWRYDPWRGSFYPKDLPQRAELQYASSQLPVIEINGSFYSLQRPQSYASWYADTPADFMFTIKAPKFITHVRQLKDAEGPLANFLASGLFNLEEKLGPILWQLPPFLKFDPERLEAFLKLLPHDTEQAAAIARNHDDWMAKRSQLEIDAKRPMRHALEVRNDSFMTPAFVDLLRKYDVALVIAETARKWPMTHDITADFVYMRLHGDQELYKSGYSDKALDRWAKRIRAWQSGSEPEDAEKVSPQEPPTSAPRDVFCFFDNTDVKLRAPFDAQTLMRKLGIGAPAPDAGGEADTVAEAALAPEMVSAPTVARRRPAPADGDTPETGRTQRGKARLAKSGAAPRKVPKKKAATVRAKATAGAKRAAPAKRPAKSPKSAASASRRRAATGSRRSSARSS
ncbi:MAG: DUF72 domain-containing protein [Proteobacteria bacterium]|nr:DUF72 domain-containing protein [Pseudomonadota bacterium]